MENNKDVQKLMSNTYLQFKNQSEVDLINKYKHADKFGLALFFLKQYNMVSNLKSILYSKGQFKIENEDDLFNFSFIQMLGLLDRFDNNTNDNFFNYFKCSLPFLAKEFIDEDTKRNTEYLDDKPFETNPVVHKVETKSEVDFTKFNLNKREIKVLDLIYNKEEQQTQVAKELGLSKGRISQILKDALVKCKKDMYADIQKSIPRK